MRCAFWSYRNKEIGNLNKRLLINLKQFIRENYERIIIY